MPFEAYIVLWVPADPPRDKDSQDHDPYWISMARSTGVVRWVRDRPVGSVG